MFLECETHVVTSLSKCLESLIGQSVQTTEKEIIRKEKHVNEVASADEETIYKIDVPANRCVFISLSLSIFLLNNSSLTLSRLSNQILAKG